MQYERGAVAARRTTSTILAELPAKNIDTGMGLERMASLLQGVDNLYEIDEVRPILDRAARADRQALRRELGHAASESDPDDVRLRVIADHVRTALMLIGDGVTPVQRGPRLRAAPDPAPSDPVDAAAGLSSEPALPQLLPVARDCMAPSYPELADEFERISLYRLRRGGGVPRHPRAPAPRSWTLRSPTPSGGQSDS